MVNDSNESERSRNSRRKFLAAVGATGAAGLAGCSGNGEDGDPTDTTTTTTSDDDDDGGDGTTTEDELGMVEGATYTTYIDTPPSDTDITFNPYYYRTQWPRLLYPFAMDRKVSVDQRTGEMIPMAATDWSYNAEEITFTFHEDARWSDGVDYLGKDYALPLLLDRAQGRSPEEVRNSDSGPRNITEAITDITWDGKTATLHSEDGWFEDFYTSAYVRSQLSHAGASTLAVRAEDFVPDASVPDFQEVYDEVKDDLWSDATSERLQEYGNTLQNWRADEEVDPSDIPVTGPFKVSEVRSDRVIMEKNPEFRRADDINFPNLEAQIIQSSQALNAALNSDILDGTTGLLHKPPANIIDTFPNHLQNFQHSGAAPTGLLANRQAVDWLGDWRVRHALAYALNKPNIARVIHRTAASAPDYPPGLMRTDGRQWVPEDRWDDFLMYEYNVEEARRLMREAGFTMEDGTWITPDGETASLTMLSGAQNVQTEQVMISQLNSFGLDVSLETQEGTTVSERVDAGDFQLTTHTWPTNPQGLYFRAMQQSVRRHTFGVFSDEETLAWIEANDNIENVEYDWTNNVEGFTIDQTKDVFTIEAPPVGQPEATDQMREYPVVYLGLLWGTNLSEERRQEIMTEICWAFNWDLTYIPVAREFQLAFQDMQNWNAPTEPGPWKQGGPQHQLMRQGEIQANPDADW